MRPTWADIDLGAVRHNVRALVAAVAPADVCVVVKADGYGHGATPVGEAAVEVGAAWLAVALVSEGTTLRAAGVQVPILVLSEPRPAEMAELVAQRLTPTVYSDEGLAAAAAAAAHSGSTMAVHLKVDTGMGRVGASAKDVLTLARAIENDDVLTLGAVWTHCAVADVPDDSFTDHQFDLFERAVADVEAHDIAVPMRHAGNSAVAIAHPRGHYDMVRCGLAAYGVAPSRDLEGRLDLRPAMTLRSEVSFLKRVAPGQSLSYGLTWTAEHETTIATVPIGYADGIRRRSSVVGGQVLIGGRKCPMVATITMDQLMVDCGQMEVRPGDEVVIIGRQGDNEITVQDWAARLDTISWEILCDIERRVSRRYF